MTFQQPCQDAYIRSVQQHCDWTLDSYGLRACAYYFNCGIPSMLAAIQLQKHYAEQGASAVQELPATVASEQISMAQQPAQCEAHPTPFTT